MDRANLHHLPTYANYAVRCGCQQCYRYLVTKMCRVLTSFYKWNWFWLMIVIVNSVVNIMNLTALNSRSTVDHQVLTVNNGTDFCRSVVPIQISLILTTTTKLHCENLTQSLFSLTIWLQSAIDDTDDDDKPTLVSFNCL